MLNCQCSNLVKSTSITISGVNLRIAIPAQSLANGQRICICLAQPIPVSAVTLVVQIVVGATVRQVITPCANLLYSDQKYQGTCKTVATSRTVLCVKYASDNLIFVYDGKCKLCPTKLPFPITPMARMASLSSVEGIFEDTIANIDTDKNEAFPLEANTTTQSPVSVAGKGKQKQQI